jgi:hypothetical protein
MAVGDVSADGTSVIVTVADPFTIQYWTPLASTVIAGDTTKTRLRRMPMTEDDHFIEGPQS